MNITILGTGVYGLSMAVALSKNESNKITMWTESSDNLKKFDDYKKHGIDAFNGVKIPKSINITDSYETALIDAQIVFIMCAAKYVGEVSKKMKPYINKNQIFIIGSKGIEQGSCRFVHEVFLSNIKTKKLGVISGPSFAIDIANEEPIGLACAVKSHEVFTEVSKIYKGTNIKLRESKDMVGTELCGSIKNVIAIASGILEGLGYSESTRCFLITESLHDIRALIVGLGGKKNSILSFAGVGDLTLTATSTKSRNYTYGVLLGKGNKKKTQEYLDSTTVEGYYTLKSIYQLIKRKKIKMPVIDLIYKIVMKDEDPIKLERFLMEK